MARLTHRPARHRLPSTNFFGGFVFMGKVESADLILKLYDLRREETMRKARNWMFSFNPKSAEDIGKTMMDLEVGAYLRMVLSYWDMAAALVNHGAIDPDMFAETNTEYIGVYAKME